MKRFRYAFDPLCVAAVVLYALNRWLCRGHVHSVFLRCHFNDLLTVAAALPPVLWAQRFLGWRTHDDPPRLGEVVFHVTIWAVICEGIGPFLFKHGTADWIDVAAYAVGGGVALLFWTLRSSASSGSCKTA